MALEDKVIWGVGLVVGLYFGLELVGMALLR